jgi:aminoglycoside 6-adenylyltransferase
MRTEKEMFELILGTAKNDERIRAVLMGGSRTNPNAKKDFFQDYDIIYIVKNIESFTSDHRWVDRFGERIMMQMPEDMGTPPPSNLGQFVYLMWFKDGNRIDLTLIPLERMDELLHPESLRTVLLDKDGIIGELPPSSDKDFHVKKPSKKEFQDVCNEFWWICLNMSKGLWREELPYTKFMFEQINRNVLHQMLGWSIGVRTDFSIGIGSFGKYLKRYLEEDEWVVYTETFADANEENIWESLFAMCNLFRKTAIHVAGHFGYEYPYEDDKKVSAHLVHIRNLPKNANEMY